MHDKVECLEESADTLEEHVSEMSSLMHMTITLTKSIELTRNSLTLRTAQGEITLN